MPVMQGGASFAKNYFERVVVIWKPTGSELTTVGPTVYPLCQVKAGDRVIQVDCRVRTGFDGAGAAMTVGDGTAADGFMDAGDITEATPGLYPGNATWTATHGKLYAADDTVDLSHTGNAGSTVGEAVFVIWILKGRY